MWPEAFLAREATSSITSLLSDACTVGKPTSTVLSAALGRRDSGVDRMRQQAERPGPPWPVVEPRSAHDDAIGTLARS